MFRYIRLNIIPNAPISVVKGEDYRRFVELKASFASQTVVSIIFNLVAWVEKCIAEEWEGTRGALLYNGWSCSHTHYVYAAASYCTTVAEQVCGKSEESYKHCFVVLALSPMGRISTDDFDADDNNDKTSYFSARRTVNSSSHFSSSTVKALTTGVFVSSATLLAPI